MTCEKHREAGRKAAETRRLALDPANHCPTCGQVFRGQIAPPPAPATRKPKPGTKPPAPPHQNGTKPGRPIARIGDPETGTVIDYYRREDLPDFCGGMLPQDLPGPSLPRNPLGGGRARFTGSKTPLWHPTGPSIPCADNCGHGLRGNLIHRTLMTRELLAALHGLTGHRTDIIGSMGGRPDFPCSCEKACSKCGHYVEIPKGRHPLCNGCMKERIRQANEIGRSLDAFALAFAPPIEVAA